MTYVHTPVMTGEVLQLLRCRPGGTYVDGTLGGGGHARLIAGRIAPGGCLVGLDRDRDALANARHGFSPRDVRLHLVHATFADLPDVLEDLGIAAVDGILLDLGLSLHHLQASGRGFSFQRDEPLDMRMDIACDTTAADIVNRLDTDGLTALLQRWGEERFARRIARHLVAARRRAPVATSAQLARLVREAVPARAAATARIHPATRVFQALRIAVNHELEHLERFLTIFLPLVADEGRVCILAFHSLEDRLVKQHFRRLAGCCTCPPGFPICVCGGRRRVTLLTPRPLRPGPAEVAANPMARSTRLRAVAKLAGATAPEAS